MNYADAIELPINIKLTDGTALTVPQLSTRDYLPWLAEWKDEVQKRDIALIPKDWKSEQRFQATRQIMLGDFIPEDLIPRIRTGIGTIRVIEMAIVKAIKAAGESEATATAKATAFIDGNTSMDNSIYALKMSGLVTVDDIARTMGLLPPLKSDGGQQAPNESPPLNPGA